MAVATFVMFDPTATAGSQFVSAAVRAEIGLLGSTDIPAGGVTSTMLAAGAVDTAALAAGAVDTAALGDAAVTAVNIASGAVTAGALATGAVTPAAVGPGIPTSTNVNGVALAMTLVVITSSDYAALSPKNPNALYFVI